MNYCFKCGTKIEEGNFCCKCGTPLNVNVSTTDIKTASHTINPQVNLGINPLSVAGFVLSIMAIWTSALMIIYAIVGLILLIIGLVQSKANNQKRIGLSVAGLVIIIFDILSWSGQVYNIFY